MYSKLKSLNFIGCNHIESNYGMTTLQITGGEKSTLSWTRFFHTKYIWI